MKTYLKQQVALINAIALEPNKAQRVLLLRRWLEENGYEDLALCTHSMVYRRTGKCTSCGKIAEMGSTGSGESVETLRGELRG